MGIWYTYRKVFQFDSDHTLICRKVPNLYKRSDNKMKYINDQMEIFLGEYENNMRVSDEYKEYAETNLEDMIDLLTYFIIKINGDYIKCVSGTYDSLNEEFCMMTSKKQNYYIRLNEIKNIKFIREV